MRMLVIQGLAAIIFSHSSALSAESEEGALLYKSKTKVGDRVLLGFPHLKIAEEEIAIAIESTKGICKAFGFVETSGAQSMRDENRHVALFDDDGNLKNLFYGYYPYMATVTCKTNDN